ncbi:MAG: hypothetical protein ACPG8W_01655 [Candidatus Promineifilaceae bacterium]
MGRKPNTKLKAARSRFPIGSQITNKHNGATDTVISVVLHDMKDGRRQPSNNRQMNLLGSTSRYVAPVIKTASGGEWTIKMLERHFDIIPVV